MLYRLYIIDNDGEQRFAIQNTDRDKMVERGELWVNCMMIRSFYIVEVEDKK
jgi:hypothetical protein